MNPFSLSSEAGIRKPIFLCFSHPCALGADARARSEEG